MIKICEWEWPVHSGFSQAEVVLSDGSQRMPNEGLTIPKSSREGLASSPPQIHT